MHQGYGRAGCGYRPRRVVRVRARRTRAARRRDHRGDVPARRAGGRRRRGGGPDGPPGRLMRLLHGARGRPAGAALDRPPERARGDGPRRQAGRSDAPRVGLLRRPGRADDHGDRGEARAGARRSALVGRARRGGRRVLRRGRGRRAGAGPRRAGPRTATTRSLPPGPGVALDAAIGSSNDASEAFAPGDLKPDPAAVGLDRTAPPAGAGGLPTGARGPTRPRRCRARSPTPTGRATRSRPARPSRSAGATRSRTRSRWGRGCGAEAMTRHGPYE